MTLTWREATKADRPLLQQFICTDPAPREPGKRPHPHPKKYELDVQKAIHVLGVPMQGADGTALLGFDASGELAAVAVWTGFVDKPDLYKIRLIAVSRAHRSQGGSTARHCLNEVLRRIGSAVPEAQVFALIDKENASSQRLFADRGFARHLDGPLTDLTLEMWAAQLPT